MATPRNVTTLLQNTFPNDALVRLGDDMYLFDTSTSKYVRLVTASSVIETNALLTELNLRAREIVEHLRLINEADLGEF